MLNVRQTRTTTRGKSWNNILITYKSKDAVTNDFRLMNELLQVKARTMRWPRKVGSVI